MRFIKPLGQRGFGHIELVLLIAFIAIFSFVGIRVMNSSNADGGYVCYIGPATKDAAGMPWYSTVVQNRTGVATATLTDIAWQGQATSSTFTWYGNNQYVSWTTGFSGAKILGNGTVMGKVRQPTNPTGVGQGDWTFMVHNVKYKCATTTNATTTFNTLVKGTTTTTTTPTTTPAPTTTAPKPTTTTPAPAPTHTNTAVTDSANCTLRGRVWSGSSCGTTCASGQGSLVTSGTYAYCSGAVSASISSSACSALNRKWLTDGCARHAVQASGGVYASAIQCVSTAQSYYVQPTYDVCDTSKAAAAAKAASTAKTTPPKTTTPVKTITVTTAAALKACKADYANNAAYTCVLKPSAVVTCASTGQTVYITHGSKCIVTGVTTCYSGYIKSTFTSGSSLKTVCSIPGCPVTDTSFTTIAHGKICKPTYKVICTSGYVAHSNTTTKMMECKSKSVVQKVVSAPVVVVKAATSKLKQLL